MSRKEYLEQLRQALHFLPEDGRAAAMAFYAEMLDDRMEDGMDEESAAAAMEAPAAIAERLRAEGIEEIKAASPLRLGIRDEALEFASLADGALKGIESAMRTAEKSQPAPAAEAPAAEPAPEAPETPETPEAPEAPASGEREKREKASWEEATDSAFESMGRALETMGKKMETLFSEQGDQNQKNASGEYERKEIAVPVEKIDAVRLEVSDMPIAVRPAEGNEVILVYYTSPRDRYAAEVDGGTLALRSVGRDRGRGFTFSLLSSGMKLIWGQTAPTVELFVPGGALLDLWAQTSNGSIRLEEVQGLCCVQMKTSNSRISVRKASCKSLEVQTSNSRLVLEQAKAKQFIRGRTSNARIEAAHVLSGGEINLKASNGRVVLDDVKSAGALTAVSSNGALQVERVAAPSVTLRTSNAAIRGVLPGKKADWGIQSGTSNSKNSLPRQQEGKRPLSAFTSNAPIEIKFEED